MSSEKGNVYYLSDRQDVQPAGSCARTIAADPETRQNVAGLNGGSVSDAESRILNPESSLRGTLLTNEPMARRVSWRAGGAVARAYEPADLADLCAFLAALRTDEPVLLVGLGSNLLVRDGGFDGTVIFTQGLLNTLRLEEDGTIYAEVGVASPKLSRFAASNNKLGAEFLAGIPGSLGGALAMNAGCYGGETWNHIDRVLTVNRKGGLQERRPEDFAIGYRHVGLKTLCDEWFVAAWWRFAEGDGTAAREEIRALLDKRQASQPLGIPNAGSVFRNPEGNFAAKLIQEAGLKGYAVGGAQVSEKHANFIVNPEGKASAEDIEQIIEHVQATVWQRYGVKLVREVRIVGERKQESGFRSQDSEAGA